MTHLFLISASGDEPAVRLRQDLAALGYQLWPMPPHLTPNMVSYGRAWDNAVLACQTVVVAWNAVAAQDEWVERTLRVAQQLRKPVCLLPLDDTPPPVEVNARLLPTSDLAALREHLPSPTADDSAAVTFQMVAVALASDLIRERRKGIEQLRDLLNASATTPEYRELALAWLEHLARTDLMGTMQDLAKSVLAAEAQKHIPPLARPDDSRHMFGVRCAKGHVTWFDKRRVCHDHTTFPRTLVRRADADLSELLLTCAQCGEQVKVRVDCEGYQ